MKQCSFIRFNIFLYVLVFFIFSFSNVFASQFEEDRERDRNITLSNKTACLNLKKNNFEDFKESPPRFTYLYINTLLDYIVDHNRDILKDNGLENQEFCIYLSDDKKDETEDKGNGLILFQVSDLILPFFERNDVDIASTISHELAHDILNHKELISDKMSILYEKFLEDNSIKNKTPKNFELYYKKHPMYLKYAKQYEIAADELGFKLYLNSGFVPEKYGLSLLKLVQITAYYHLFNTVKESRTTVFSTLSDEEFSFFKSISIPEKCIELGKESLKQNQLDRFMKKIKYIPNFVDPHPTSCWRFWNIIEKIITSPDQDKLKQNTTLDAIFLKVDLNKSQHLDDLKNAVKNQDTQKINKYFFIAINDLVSADDPYKIKYTVDTQSKRAVFYEADNYIVIKFYNFLVRPLLEQVHN